MKTDKPNKIIFVTYGNECYYESLKRIRAEAEATRLFNEILTFTDKDLPDEIQNHPLMRYKRGGGYWLWKPWAVLQALNMAGENDIVVYSDCGNTIYTHPQWQELFHKLRKHDAIFYYNGGKMEAWSSKIMMNHFKLSCKMGGGKYQFTANFFLLKNKSKPIIQLWLDEMLTHPEIVVDVSQQEIGNESRRFIEHRHDQAVLSGVVYSKFCTKQILILPNFSESLKRNGQAVYNSRISDLSIRKPAIPDKTILTFLKRYVIRPYRQFRMWLLKLLDLYI